MTSGCIRTHARPMKTGMRMDVEKSSVIKTGEEDRSCVEHTRKQQERGAEAGWIVLVAIIPAPVGTCGWDRKQGAILCSIHVCSASASVTSTNTNTHTLRVREQLVVAVQWQRPVVRVTTRQEQLLVLEEHVCVGPELITFHLVRKWQE